MRSLLFWQQVTEAEAVIPQYSFTDTEFDPIRHVRAVENKGMEFTFLAAGINCRRQLGQHLVIIQPTGKLLIDYVCIDAAEDRLEPLGDKLPSQFGRVRSP